MRRMRTERMPPLCGRRLREDPMFLADAAVLAVERDRERERLTQAETARRALLRRLMAIKSYLHDRHACELRILDPALSICGLDGEIDAVIVENDDDDCELRCSVCLEVEWEFVICAQCAKPAPMCEGCLDNYVLGGATTCHVCRGPMLQPAKNRQQCEQALPN